MERDGRSMSVWLSFNLNGFEDGWVVYRPVHIMSTAPPPGADPVKEDVSPTVVRQHPFVDIVRVADATK